MEHANAEYCDDQDTEKMLPQAHTLANYHEGAQKSDQVSTVKPRVRAENGKQRSESFLSYFVAQMMHENDMKVYFSRFFSISCEDLASAFGEMRLLLTDRKQYAKMTRWNYQIRQRWSRKDPAFAVLMVLVHITICLFYNIFFATTIDEAINRLQKIVLLHFVGMGFLFTVLPNYFARRYMVKASASQPVDLTLSYSFDVFLNSFFVFIVINYGIMFVISPVLLINTIGSRITASVVNVIANYQFYSMMFSGYSSLPFLHKTEYFLAPIIVHAGVQVLLLTLSQNYFLILVKHLV